MYNLIIESGSHDSTVSTINERLGKYCPLKFDIVHFIEVCDTDKFIAEFNIALEQKTPNRFYANGFFINRKELNAVINYATERHPELNKMEDEMLEFRDNPMPDMKKMIDIVIPEPGEILDEC